MNTFPLCDHLPAAFYPWLRAELPGIALVKVVHVTDSASVNYAVAGAANVDSLLLDSDNPILAVKELGDTGRAHDWTLSRRIRDAIRISLFLASGLTSANVSKPSLPLSRFVWTCAAASARATNSTLSSSEPSLLPSQMKSPKMRFGRLVEGH